MSHIRFNISALLVSVSSLIGAAGIHLTCPDALAQKSSDASRTPLPGSVALENLPGNAQELVDVVKGAKMGDAVVLRGRIADAPSAFSDHLAKFQLIDDAASSALATIQIVGDNGLPLPDGVSGKGGLKAGAEVFVVGKVVGAGGTDGFVVNASGIHVPRSGLPVGFFRSEAPANAKDVTDVRKSTDLKKGEMIVLRGVIGGSISPFVAGRAVFTLMGSGLKPCSANPDDKCKTPWDYCCEEKSAITANSATVRVVDAKGNPLRTDFKGRRGIKELSEVVVVGTVAVSDSGALIVNATGIYVAPLAAR